jgi:two-component system sensor histidine kinase/response regulator
MDVSEALFSRRSIRQFSDRSVQQEAVEHLLRAAFAGPIGTKQECRYFVVIAGSDKQQLIDEVIQPGLERLREALEDCAARRTVDYTRSLVQPLRSAPVVIAAYMELIGRDESLALPTVSAAVENLLLAAHERGLGACWITGANYLAEDISEALGIQRKQLVALIPIGYPDSEPRRKARPVRADWRGLKKTPASQEQVEIQEEPIPDWLEQPPTPAPGILIADDRASVRTRIAHILKAAGYQVREADSWDSMLAAIQNECPALIILDAFLTDTCVSDVAAQLSDVTEAYVPVLVTARAYHLEDKARALAMGADGFLAKPVRWPELLGQVRSLLRTKHLYDQLAKARDDLQQLMHHRQRLTDMIVHDLRSPLGGIIGTMEYVLEDESSTLDDGARELLDLSLASGRQLVGMVNDLLDMSKMSEVGLPVRLESVQIGEISRAALGQVAPLAAEKQIDLSSDVPDDLPSVQADREKLQRVLVNLLGNAIKFTPEAGRVNLAARLQGEGRTLAVSVSDTGIGIPQSEHERIFDLFSQVEHEAAERAQGTGLGLAFCKMVVESHGGTISVESEEGKGSTFTVRLPLPSPGKADGA